MKKICLLGSTGSIGRQTLEIVKSRPDDFRIFALAYGYNIGLLQKQIEIFKPKLVSVAEKEDAVLLKDAYPDIEVLSGGSGLIRLATVYPEDKDMIVVNALVGIAGLGPTVATLESGREIALANKESLVAGGALVKKAREKTGAIIRPIDSEHSGLWQCLEGEKPESIRKVYITASGGAFRDLSRSQLKNVNAEDALKHPNWKMGKKVTVDSATMINKGFEMIEAHYLFDIPMANIVPLLHRESLVHGMVEFTDGSIVAQMSTHDMRLAIAHALDWPKRNPGLTNFMDFGKAVTLDFEPIDHKRYPMIDLAISAMEKGDTYPAVLNGANEAAVGLFLKGDIGFLDIEEIVEKALKEHKPIPDPTLENILDTDQKTKEAIIGKYSK